MYCQPIMYIAGLAAIEVRCFWISDDFGPFCVGLEGTAAVDISSG